MSGDVVARRGGRPPLTDRVALLGAARQIGFTGLTVTAVTAAVGVKYSTFYRHFPSLDALVTDLVDQVCETELVLPAAGPSWQDTVRDTCRAVAELLDRHPGMATTVIALAQWPGQVVALYRGLTEVLLAAGFDGEQAAVGAVTALETITATALTTPGPGRSLAERQHRLDTADPPIDPGVRAATAGLVDQPASAWSMRKIGLLIRGLEADLAASHRDSPS